MVGVDVTVQRASYGLELVDALTMGPLVGSFAVVETSSGATAYLVSASRWVFSELPAAPATFAITADFYVAQTVKTGGALLPDPVLGGAGYLATIEMVPRTGYPFPPTLTRVVGVVRFGSAPVPGATVTLTASHSKSTANASDPPVTVTTTDDGQYTYWFLPQLKQSPTIADQLTIAASATIGGVTHAVTVVLPQIAPN